MGRVRWDKEVDYEAMYQALLRSLSRERGMGKCYSAIGLIALRNGLRASEAIEAFKLAVRTGATVIEVRTRKKKREELRKAIIPEKVKPVLGSCHQLLLIEDEKLKWRFSTWLRRRHKVNPHSLRYSFITYAVTVGFDSAFISKVINHSRIDQLRSYIQKRMAEKHVLESSLFEL